MPLTAQEIMELDDYCAARHIELVPSLSTFGHMYPYSQHKNLLRPLQSCLTRKKDSVQLYLCREITIP